MKKKFFKLTALTLAIAFATSAMLIGCANDPTASTTGSSSSVSASSSGDTASAGSTDSVKKDPYTLDMYYINYGSPLEDLPAVQDEMSKILKNKINASIVLHPIDSGAWTDKVNLMFSSGEKIDIIPSSAGLVPRYDTTAQNGAYKPLDDLLNEYGKDIIQILGIEYIKGATINGKIYGVPINKEKGYKIGYIFNRTLAEKYKFDLTTIKTYSDIEPMLKTIKENEAGITPLCLSGRNLTSLRDTIPSAGEVFGEITVLPNDTKDYKVSYLFEYSPFLDLLDWGHQMYLNGYVNKSSLTDTDEGPMKAGKAFCMPYEAKPGKDAELSAAWGYEIVSAELTKAIMPSSQATGIMTSICNTSEDPARAMQFINLLYADKQLLNTLIFGIENKNYVKVSDNIIDYPSGVTSKTVGYANQGWLFGSQFNNYLWKNEDPQKWANFEEFNSTVLISPVLGFVFDSSALKTEVAAIASVREAYERALATGAVDPKKAVPEFMTKLKAAGSDKIKDAMQEQLDAWVKVNKK